MSDVTPPCRVNHRVDSDDDNSDSSISTVLTGSSARLFYETSMPEESKWRVDLATEGLSGRRCLIENTDEANVLHYTHCLDRGTKDHILDALEFSWGMPHGTLNLDTHYNVFRLGSKFHALYGKKKPAMCIFLPEENIIRQYHDARKDRSKFPNIDEPSYKYNFLAHDDMISVPIHRLTPSDDLEVAPPADAYEYFAHPYDTFGPVVSHIHPRFVICDIGNKMDGGALSFLGMARLYPSRVHVLHMVAEIWKAWTSVAKIPDFIAFCEKPYAGDNISSTSKGTSSQRLYQSVSGGHTESASSAGNMSNISNHTPPRRLFQSVKKRRGDHNESPSRASKRFKEERGENRSVWLDDKTRREHDSKFSSKASWKHKKASISHWTKAVGKTGIPVEQTMNLDTIMDEAEAQ